MEADAIAEMFQRLKGLHRIYIGDSDGKTNKDLIEAKLYGDELEVKKKECMSRNKWEHIFTIGTISAPIVFFLEEYLKLQPHTTQWFTILLFAGETPEKTTTNNDFKELRVKNSACVEEAFFRHKRH
ncbi:hypothetical protein J437_LFUL012155 [Ladona fulva]|uniref:Uncharacterized protein n=1 Tax=Ladona fulva TaxID=123851 RepID=A0A8K0P605_LADFU|nr:hypothetical protein J437_LFUL012155 [Ladona fulva]